ncbi:Hsp70 family protein [Nocardia sp. NPDC047038]|uniref:Hsp70 family protein n=1 Tax=Nocardia sp. NPDC047038 TaxID=3154338 RepID=UPI0033D1B624
MRMGWGVSVGSQNTVCVSISSGGDPVVHDVRTRTAAGSERPGQASGTGDLATSEPGLVSPDLISRSLENVMAAAGAVAEHTVLAHPAIYRRRHLRSLREALDRCGLGAVELVAEPLAAAAFLRHSTTGDDQRAAVDSAATLVYDLGARSLDIAVVVRQGSGHRIAGAPARSYRFGGRCTAAAIAAARHDRARDDERTPDSGLISEVCAALVRESLALVDECVRSAGLPPRQLGAVMLVGGAATPPEVAHSLADLLQIPVVRGQAPAQSVAFGAALLGAERPALDTVMVPLRRPAIRTAAALAAIAAPVLFVGAAQLTSPDLGRTEYTAALPDRRFATGSIDSPGVVSSESLPVTSQDRHVLFAPAGVNGPTSPSSPTVVAAMTWTPEPMPDAVTDEPSGPPTPPSEDDSAPVTLAATTEFPDTTVLYTPSADESDRPHHSNTPPPATGAAGSPPATAGPPTSPADPESSAPVHSAPPSATTPTEPTPQDSTVPAAPIPTSESTTTSSESPPV